MVAAQSNTPTRSVGGSPLASPSTLTDLSPDPRTAEFRLTAAPGRLALAPGSLTDVYVYNGRVPGPTMIVREGDRVIVHFRNDLPVPTTVHWHGLHLHAE